MPRKRCLTQVNSAERHRSMIGLDVHNADWEEAMSIVRVTALFVLSIAAAATCMANQASAQQKYTISGAAGAPGQYSNEHAIEVGDVPGHRVRVYEIHHDYPQHDLAYAGVA